MLVLVCECRGETQRDGYEFASYCACCCKDENIAKVISEIALLVPTVSILIASSLSVSLILPCCFLALLSSSDAEFV